MPHNGTTETLAGVDQLITQSPLMLNITTHIRTARETCSIAKRTLLKRTARMTVISLKWRQATRDESNQFLRKRVSQPQRIGKKLCLQIQATVEAHKQLATRHNCSRLCPHTRIVHLLIISALYWLKSATS